MTKYFGFMSRREALSLARKRLAAIDRSWRFRTDERVEAEVRGNDTIFVGGDADNEDIAIRNALGCLLPSQR